MSKTDKYKLLAIDEDPSQLQVLAYGLSKEYDLILSTSAETALELIYAGELPDLILLDLMMPTMDGYEFCKHIQSVQHLKHIPIICLTVLNDEHAQITALNAGASDYLHKPVSLPILKARVNRLVERTKYALVTPLQQPDSALFSDSSPTANNLVAANSQSAQHNDLGNALELANVGVMLCDEHCRVRYVNEAYCSIFATNADSIVGTVAKFCDNDNTPLSYHTFWKKLNEQGFWIDEVETRRANGERFVQLRNICIDRSADGEVNRYIITINDITALQNDRDAQHALNVKDHVTGLPSRALMSEKIQDILSECKETETFAALIHLDLNRFRRLADSLGYASAELVILQFVERVRKILHNTDVMGSLGRDEILILLDNYFTTYDGMMAYVQHITDQISSAMSEPFVVDKIGELRLSVTIGVAMLPDDFATPEEALRAADIAHNYAKDAKLDVAYYKQEVDIDLKSLLLIQSKLEKAIVDEQLVCFVQEQVDSNGKLCGVETLVRWQCPDSGMISPGKFIPIAESTGLIVGLDKWMLRQSCQLIAQLVEHDLPYRVSVNISSTYFENNDFVPELRHVLNQTNAKPQQLVLEVTERLLIANIDDVINKMSEINNLGVSISIDDFGTGYSSLNYLRQLPIQELKIDQSFIFQAPEQQKDAEIVALISSLAQALNLRVVAEGVETQKHAAFISRQFPMMEQQGFYYSRPHPANEWIEKLQTADNEEINE